MPGGCKRQTGEDQGAADDQVDRVDSRNREGQRQQPIRDEAKHKSGPKERPTSRQRMQRLANEPAAQGLVEFIDDPRHRRSKLVRLTPKGATRHRKLDARFLSIASTMGVALGEVDIRQTIELVRHLSADVRAHSERLS